MREWLKFIFRLSWSMSLGELQRIINIFSPQTTAEPASTEGSASIPEIVDATRSTVKAVSGVAHTGWSPMAGGGPS
jgi:hypothetical protein